MSRKLSSTVIGLALGLVLAGCGKDAGDTGTLPPPAATKQAQADVSVTAATAPPTAAAVPPPVAGQTAVTPAGPEQPPNDSDILGGNGRPLTEQEKIVLNYGLDMFKNEKGRYPKDLAEAVASKHITRLPKMAPNEQLNYDPTTGKVTVTTK